MDTHGNLINHFLIWNAILHVHICSPFRHHRILGIDQTIIVSCQQFLVIGFTNYGGVQLKWLWKVILAFLLTTMSLMAVYGWTACVAVTGGNQINLVCFNVNHFMEWFVAYMWIYQGCCQLVIWLGFWWWWEHSHTWWRVSHRDGTFWCSVKYLIVTQFIAQLSKTMYVWTSSMLPLKTKPESQNVNKKCFHKFNHLAVEEPVSNYWIIANEQHPVQWSETSGQIRCAILGHWTSDALSVKIWLAIR